MKILLMIGFLLVSSAFNRNATARPIQKRGFTDQIQKAIAYVKAIPARWRELIPDDTYQIWVTKMHDLKDKLDHFFEGDLLGTTDGRGQNGNAVLSKTAVEDKSFLWKNGLVPYEISSSFTEHEVEVIKDSLNDIMLKTCITFVAHTSEADYISFVRRQMGCSSYVARVGGKQFVDLQPGCIYELGEVQHEVMHALGFYHEQSREDRDDYVEIIWDNVKTDQRAQFTKYVSNTLGIPYDYDSIMHYGFNYFAVDITKPTILPKVKAAIGNRKVMSVHDVEKINRLYSCPPKNNLIIPSAWSAPSEVTASPDLASTPKCPVRFASEAQTQTPPSSIKGKIWNAFKNFAKEKAEKQVCNWLSGTTSHSG